MGTNIEWSNKFEGYKGETLNPFVGCKEDNTECEFCYAKGMAYRLAHMPHRKDYARLVRKTAGGKIQWTGEVNFYEERLYQAFRWQKPRFIFFDSMSDIFYEKNTFEQIDKIMATIAVTPWHIYQVFTKRPDIAYKYFNRYGRKNVEGSPKTLIERIRIQAKKMFDIDLPRGMEFPLPNMWLIVSAGRQETFNEKVPWLLKTPAAVRGVSCEPMLGPVNMDYIASIPGEKWGINPISGNMFKRRGKDDWDYISSKGAKLDWVIVGGESGSKARPMQKWWARRIKDLCEEYGTAFFFKQWGHWGYKDQMPDTSIVPEDKWINGGQKEGESCNADWMYPVGKAHSGKQLDGVTYNQYPRK